MRPLLGAVTAAAAYALGRLRPIHRARAATLRRAAFGLYPRDNLRLLPFAQAFSVCHPILAARGWRRRHDHRPEPVSLDLGFFGPRAGTPDPTADGGPVRIPEEPEHG